MRQYGLVEEFTCYCDAVRLLSVVSAIGFEALGTLSAVQRARRARRVNSSAPIHRYTDIYPPCPDRRIGVPAYRRISCPVGVSAYLPRGWACRRTGVSAYRRIGVFPARIGVSAYRRICLVDGRVGKSGAPHQSQGPSSEIRGGKSSDFKIRGAPSVPGSILGEQGWSEF